MLPGQLNPTQALSHKINFLQYPFVVISDKILTGCYSSQDWVLVFRRELDHDIVIVGVEKVHYCFGFDSGVFDDFPVTEF
jgi:hypothetical protein